MISLSFKSSLEKGVEKMAGVNREWVEKIKEVIANAYNAGEIKTLEDFNTFALSAWNQFGIKDNRLRTIVVSMVGSNNAILTTLREKAAEIHLPITNDSPVQHLPISKKLLIILHREGFVTVGNIVSSLTEQRVDMLYFCRNMGPKRLEELLRALKWAGISLQPESLDNGKEPTLEAKGILDIGVTLPPDKIPFQVGRIIQLESGEIFTTEIVSDRQTYVRVFSVEKSFGVMGRRVTITVEG